MDDTHTDGNGVAGLLSQLLAVDATSIVRRCQGCGGDYAMGAHPAFHGAGVVLRCPNCGDIAVRVVEARGTLTVELRGAYQVAVQA